MRLSTKTQRMKWNDEQLEQLTLNPTDSRYLAKIGLPVVDEQALKYKDRMQRFDFLDQQLILFGELRLAGEIPLYLRPDEMGVWAIDIEKNQLGQMNSSAESFAKFILLREKYLLDFPQLIPTSIHREFVSLVAKAMTAIDSKAMAKEGFWLPYMYDMQEYSTDYSD